VVAIACVAALLPAGCGGSNAAPDPAVPKQAEPTPPKRESRATSERRWPRRAQCPPDAANCRAARGTIVYIERVDPDGDGDAHFVLASSDSVSGPGLSVIDVEKGMRPKPLPQPGDRVTAAGPVYRGSYGQRQIEATELHVLRVHPRR
jgi:hypothetical protein